MTQQSVETEITGKTVYVCPHCHTEYDDMESAKECISAYKWRDNIDIESLKWHWLILKNQYAVCAILPYKVDNDYVWTDHSPCIRRYISCFNLFTYEFFNISPSNEKAYGEWILLEKLDITEGYKKYGLVPPLTNFTTVDIPESVLSEMKTIIYRAIQERTEEIGLALGEDIETMKSLLAKFTLPNLVTEKIQILPKSRLIDTKNIFHLEKVLPEFASEVTE